MVRTIFDLNYTYMCVCVRACVHVGSVHVCSIRVCVRVCMCVRMGSVHVCSVRVCMYVFALTKHTAHFK